MQLNDKEFYQKISKKELSNKEVFEAKQNFVGFFDLLYKIEKRHNEQTNDKNNGNSNHSSQAK